LGTAYVGTEQFYLYLGASLLALVLISDRKLGPYPSPLPQIRQRQRELIEAFMLWAIDVILISYFFLSLYLQSLPYPELLITSYISISPTLLTSLILPPVFLRFWRRTQERQALGLGFKIFWRPAALLIILMTLSGFMVFLIRGGYLFPFPQLVWRLVSPSFEEELIYRGGIQTKLERATSPRAAWFIGGVLFGLVHVPTDFFGFIWVYYGRSVINSLSFLFTQITFGWLIGIFFIKSRSLYPCVIGHYLFDFLPDILAHLV